VPPRRSTRGRHRRPKSSTVAPAYFTVATVAAFTVSGLNVPSAIGAAKSGRDRAAHTTDNQASSLKAASALRERIARQDKARVSRLRTDRAEALQAAQEAGRRARLAAEKARPKWVLPIQGYHLTAGFGEYGLWSHAHTGQDFAAPVGTPVRALADGVVIFAAYDGAYGNKIAIQHEDGLVTWYAHLSAYEVAEGDKVQGGQLIGRVGSTGNTTGPHLHLEIRPHNADPVDPLPWLRAHDIKY
jgi:murein DD-endopeptidase MepM/ murein hydrolase activator NlpD